MPITWNIDEHAAIVTVRVEGALTLDGARRALTALYTDPRYRSPIVDLWDLRDAEIDSGPGDVQRLLQFIQLSRGEGGCDRTALVVARPADFGISRMYQSLAEATLPFSVQVFTQLDEAYAWLGRPSHA
jgi:hypothetical protein